MIKGACRPIRWSNNRLFGSSPSSSDDGILSMLYLFEEKIPIGISSSSSLSSFLDNESLTQSAVYAFEHYQQTKRGSTTTSLNESLPSSNSRRRHRQRPTKAILSHDHHYYPPSNRKNSNDNDHFFEYQKMQGFMSSSIFRDEPALAQLQAYLFHQVCPAYFMMQRQDTDEVSRGIAHHLRQEQQEDASTSSSMIFALDLWASVHRINSNNDTDTNSSYHHGPHVHEDAILSGVYYASVPSDSTPLQFFARNPLETSTTTVPNILHEPIQGQVVVFPPWLWHAVPKIQNKKEKEEATTVTQPRVAFAFNLRTVVPGALDPWSITKATNTN